MTELFGIPLGTLLTTLAILLLLALGAVALFAVRNRVLLRLGVRNVARRGARTALIVLGLMLGTTIIAAALATGDTMSSAIRGEAIRALGQTDETISARGAEADARAELGAATGTRYFGERTVARVEAALKGSDLVDGVTPAIIEPVALRAPVRRSNEPDVTLFAADPARMKGFGTITATGGRGVELADLRAGEVFINREAADELDARRGDRVLVFTGAERPASLRVRDIVSYDGGGTDDAGVLMGLAAAQELLDRPGAVRHVLVSNTGDATSGVDRTDAVVERLRPVLAPLGLDADASKRDAIEDADAFGAAFIALFTTFGSFSIAAGILLIFLIFVMLAAERRGELGIARAIGTRRSHLVQMFLFEGVAYDLLAAAVGTALGAGIAFAMIAVLAQAFGDTGFDISYSVTARSLLIAYAIGVLLTLVVVVLSAARVSRMTIATAIRNLPEPVVMRRRRRIVAALATITVGLLMAVSGASAGQATPLMFGVSVVLIGLVPFLRLAAVPERLAFTGSGVTLVVLWMLPWSVWEAVFGPLAMDFSTWIVSGLMVVTGAVWTIMYNAGALLGAASRLLGRLRSVAPVLRMSMAYPLAERFRTGVTLATFTLVVFTLVTGTATSGSFQHAFGKEDAFGGGFDIRASTSPAAPVDDMPAALAKAGGREKLGVRTVSSQSLLPVQATQRGTGRALEAYSLRGLDETFLRNTTFELGARARGYGSDRSVWRALERTPGLAVVDASIAPRRDNFNFQAAPPKFKLSGFFFDDGTFDAIGLTVRDPQTGRSRKLTVVGILSDTAPFEMFGISTSQGTVAGAFPGRAEPTIHYFQTQPGVDPGKAATRLESAFLANGMQAESIADVVEENTRASRTFNRLILGFMGLGLIVGVAALGVISARSVVERRQQIGVLRSIGFRRRMVQAAFLLESTFVALTAIFVGTTLGLLLASNIIRDQRQQPSWEDITLIVPWANLAIIFAAVFVVALVATLAPALRASRVRPAEALRYQ
jgi:putative ABC transport system permease protein